MESCIYGDEVTTQIAEAQRNTDCCPGVSPMVSVFFQPIRSGAVCQKEPQADAAPTRGLPEREAGRWNPPWDIARPSGPTALSQPGGTRG